MMEEKQSKKFNMKYICATFVIFIVLVVAILLYWHYRTLHPYTDDAYVQANYINISAQVDGPIKQINVKNLQFVKKGQLLFEIDPRPFQAEYNQAKAQLALSKQQVEADEASVEVAKASVKNYQAQVAYNEKNAARILALLKQGDVSVASGDQATEALNEAKAGLASAQSQLAQAEKTLGTPGENNARIKQAEAQLETARLNLGYTRVTAPSSGYITDFELRNGSTITALQPLFILVNHNEWWVNANFKETDLARIRPGQSANISIDTYPGVKFNGIVDQISRGSGASFSILPPENATGNWVKVTQRFQVKIVIQNPDPKYPLRIGSSSEVTVNTAIEPKS